MPEKLLTLLMKEHPDWTLAAWSQLFISCFQQIYLSQHKERTNQVCGFCSDDGLTPFPMVKANLTYFVAFLYKEGLAASTVKSYLSVARCTQISLGFGDPNIAGIPQLEYVVKA